MFNLYEVILDADIVFFFLYRGSRALMSHVAMDILFVLLPGNQSPLTIFAEINNAQVYLAV